MTPESELRDILQIVKTVIVSPDDGSWKYATVIEQDVAKLMEWHRRHKERELQSAYRDIARRYFDEDKNLGQIVNEAGDDA